MALCSFRRFEQTGCIYKFCQKRLFFSELWTISRTFSSSSSSTAFLWRANFSCEQKQEAAVKPTTSSDRRASRAPDLRRRLTSGPDRTSWSAVKAEERTKGVKVEKKKEELTNFSSSSRAGLSVPPSWFCETQETVQTPGIRRVPRQRGDI